MIVAGYIRVSRVAGREGESFISPAVQREQIEAWAKLRRARVISWHEDLDVSGARAQRPGLDAAIRAVETTEAEGIVVAKLDRLARSLPVAFDAIGRIEAAGGTIISVDEGIDPSTVNGRMQRGLLLLLAEWYRDQVRENWAIACERAVRRGVTIASTVPTGYRRGQGGRLELDEEWAPVIREVFDRRAAGEPWVQLAKFMNDRGVPVQGANGNRAARWTGNTVSRLVAGRAYLGESRYGAFTNLDAHEPLVSARVWHAAQAAKGVQAARPDGVEPALLAGLVRCAGCSYGMWRGSGRGGGGSYVYGYRCRGGGTGGACRDRSFAYADELEDLVVRELLHHGGLAVEGSERDDDVEQALSELADAEHALTVFRDDPRIIGALGPDGFAGGLTHRARAVDEARQAVAAAQAPASGVPDVVTLRRIWPDLDVGERRQLIAAAIDCVVVRGRGALTADRVRICWAGLGPGGLPGRGKRGVKVRPIAFDGLPDATRPAALSEASKHD